MPSYTIHLAVAAEYLKNHEEPDKQGFLEGVLAPDFLPKPASHYGPASSQCRPDLFLLEQGLADGYRRGYYLHLLTDKLFYSLMVDMSCFSKEIYCDYDKLNARLIDRYALEIPDYARPTLSFLSGEPSILSEERLHRFIRAVGLVGIHDVDAAEKVKNALL
ncbi:MAG: hypothetical protein J6M12_05055 [Clostridia bacterium]|nr:hypothetical protein [Clostridia bacterium]